MGLVPFDSVEPLQRLGDVPVERLLADHWQREPCILRQVFPAFEPELDENDVAGLACEELAEARLVTGRYPDHDWTLRHGPFDEETLTALPQRDWTLLVQDVEKHYPPLRRLMRRFEFVPQWRLDDLMVSVSAPGGSVGPHVDQYDVFLLQASGRRRWDVARRFDPERLPDSELDVLRHFEPEESWELEPGDALYLPPGIAHHGVALDTGMTWSVGLRAPSQADLFAALGDWLAGGRAEGRRYTDPPGPDLHLPGEIDATAVECLLGLLAPPEDFRAFLGGFLTTYRLAHAPAPPDRSTSPTEVGEKLAGDAILRRNPWTRLAWIAEAEGASLFAAGDVFECSREQAVTLCAGDAWRTDDDPVRPEWLTLLAALIDAGHFYLDEADDGKIAGR